MNEKQLTEAEVLELARRISEPRHLDMIADALLNGREVRGVADGVVVSIQKSGDYYVVKSQ